jgi:hypothetical protein
MEENQNEESQRPSPADRGKGFPQILHDRSRDAGSDLHRLLISLSTGTLAIYFLALTGEAKPPLSTNQKISAVISVFSVALSAACGIISMFADVRRYYLWASALQTSDKVRKRELYRHRDRWLRRERLLAPAMGALFITGMLSSLVYGAFRVFGK